MQTLSSSLVIVNPILDAHMDATDTGHRWGYEDATEGNDQRPSAYFAPNSPAWHAYNEGYREGCLHAAVLNGSLPIFVDFGSDADANYVPFQCPELYANVLPDYQREDYIGM